MKEEIDETHARLEVIDHDALHDRSRLHDGFCVGARIVDRRSSRPRPPRGLEEEVVSGLGRPCLRALGQG
jgi:hypothetical protein